MRLLSTKAVFFIGFLVFAGVAGAQGSWTAVQPLPAIFSEEDGNLENPDYRLFRLAILPICEDTEPPSGVTNKIGTLVIPVNWSQQAIRTSIIFRGVSDPAPGMGVQFRFTFWSLPELSIVVQEFSPVFSILENGEANSVSFEWTSDLSALTPGSLYYFGIARVCWHPDDTYLSGIGINSALVEFSNYYPAPVTATFPDVAPGFWAFQQIEALAAAGITTGFPDGTYRPFDPVTRAQMAAFLARALGMEWP